MLIENAERIIQKMPVVKNYYMKNAAKLKREYCLFLHQLGYLKPISFVQWLATYQCNFCCPFCEATAGNVGENELSFDEVITLIDDLAAMKVKRFVISGGEPLCRSDLIEIMRYGNQKTMIFGLVTNSYLVEELWDQLKQFKYFLYFTSIDGLPEYHDHIRKKDSFKRVMKGIALFKKIDVPSMMINTVVHPQNIDQLEDLLKLLKNLHSLWRLAPLTKTGRAESKSKYFLEGHHLKYLVKFIKKNKNVMKMDLAESHTYLGCFSGQPVGKPFFCGAGLTRCSITPDGEVMGCHDVYDNSLSEGNIRQQPFSKIWKEEFSRFREQKLFHENCKSCVHLNACQGGCWTEMKKQKICLKPIWEIEN